MVEHSSIENIGKIFGLITGKLLRLFMKKKETNIEQEKEMAYPRLLSNHACGKDLLEGKSHELIASRIVQTINEDKSVHAIGLDGDWGSGKSNVIEQMRTKLNSKRDILFVYDAWAYQSDPQKRSILESIMEFLSQEERDGKKIFDGDEWEQRKKKLLAKQKETDVVEIPKLGWGITISVLALVLTPILKYLSDLLTDCKWLQVSMLLLPFLAILTVLGFYICKNVRAKNEHWLKDALANALSIYAGKKHETTSLETISEKEPSSSKFKEWMHYIDAVLGEYKLILVFDNIDRLTVDKVRELWSVINALFAEQKYEHIIAIVPFDRAHIQFTFKSEDNDQKGQDGRVPTYGDDFINKTFNVVYRVSPPIMTAWKQFFEDKWKEAFGKECEPKVSQIFDALSDKITPRKIIAYINRFVAIKQVTKEDIPDEYIALYILGEDSIKEAPYVKIIQPDYLGALDFMYKNDEELPQYMAALYFQVKPETAIEVVYVDRLRKALDDNKDEDVKQIASLASFSRLLSRAIISVVNVPNATLALSAVEEKVEAMHWNELYAKVGTQESALQRYQKILLRHIDHRDAYLAKVIRDMYASEPFNALRFYKDINALEEMGLDVRTYIQPKRVPVKDFLSFVEEAKKNYPHYKMSCEKEALDMYLAQLTVGDLDNFTAMQYIKDDYKPLPQYRQHIEAIIENDTTDYGSVSTCYQRLKELERPVGVKLVDSDIVELFQVANPSDEFYYDLVSMRLVELDNFAATQSSIFDSITQSTNEETVEKVAHVIEYYMDYGDILLALPTYAEDYPLLKAVAQRITRKSYGIARMSIDSVLKSYNLVKSSIELDARTMLSRLDGWKSYLKTDNNLFSKLPYQLLKDCLEVKNGLTQKINEGYIAYLTSMTADEWKKKIISGSTEYQAITQLGYKARTAFEAFKALLLEHAHGKVSMDANKVQTMVDWAVRHKCGVITAFKDMRDCFIREATMTAPLFRLYADFLFKYARLEERQDSLRRIFTGVVLEDEESMNIMLQHLDTMQMIVEKSGDDAQDFKDKMLSLWMNRYAENTPEGFEELMRRIGVERGENEIEEENENQNE